MFWSKCLARLSHRQCEYPITPRFLTLSSVFIRLSRVLPCFNPYRLTQSLPLPVLTSVDWSASVSLAPRDDLFNAKSQSRKSFSLRPFNDWTASVSLAPRDDLFNAQSQWRKAAMFLTFLSVFIRLIRVHPCSIPTADPSRYRSRF